MTLTGKGDRPWNGHGQNGRTNTNKAKDIGLEAYIRLEAYTGLQTTAVVYPVVCP